jgi:hypothetical protein
MIDPMRILRASAVFTAVAAIVAFGAAGAPAAVSVGVGGLLVMAKHLATTRRVGLLFAQQGRRWALFGPSLIGVALALYFLLPLVQVPWLFLGLTSVVAAITLMGLRNALQPMQRVQVEVR